MTKDISPDITRTLAEFASTVDASRAPRAILHELSRVLIDCLGCGIAGLVTPGGQIGLRLAEKEHGPLECRLIGGERTSILPGVYANTTLINALDYEVYGPEGHVAPVVVAVALAAADAIDASGMTLLSGILAGLEIGGRIGLAVRRKDTSEHAAKVRGQAHVIFGAAAAAGRIFRLTPREMNHAFGIAGYSASVPTTRKFLTSPHGPMTKYDHLALMSLDGLLAVRLAKQGFTGDLNVLEGETGFWRFAGHETCDWQSLTEGLGVNWRANQLSYKAYPAIIYTNPTIDLTREIVRDHGLSLEEIDDVEVRSSRESAGRTRSDIRYYVDASLNSPYCIAAGLYDVRPRRSWLEPQTFHRQDVLALQERIHALPLQVGDARPGSVASEAWSPVRITVHARGEEYCGERDSLLALTDRDLIDKFFDNVLGLMEPDKAQMLMRSCWDMPSLKSTRYFTNRLPAEMKT